MTSETRPYAEIGDYTTTGELLVRERLTGQGVAALFVEGSPNGTVAGAPGQLAINTVTRDVWQNTTGSTVWVPFVGGSGSRAVFNVVSYGAVGDGVADNRLPILAACAAALAAGGGVVYFPPGVYMTGKDPLGFWCLDVPGSNLHFEGVEGLSVVKMLPGQPAVSTLLFRVDAKDNVTFASLVLDGNWGAVVGVTNSQLGINQGTQGDPQNHLIMWRGSSNCAARRLLLRQSYGDGMWFGQASASINDGCESIMVESCRFEVSARNGISFGAQAQGVTIRSCEFANIYTTAVDLEPQGLSQFVRDVLVEGCDIGSWWNGLGGSFNSAMSIVGGTPSGNNESSAARSIRVVGNVIRGSVMVSTAVDVTIRSNRIVIDSQAVNLVAPIFIDHSGDGITVEDNYVYDNSQRNVPGQWAHVAAIHVQFYASGNINLQPANVRVVRNKIHARNGNDGILIFGPGGFSIGDATPEVAQVNGAASTAVTASTLTDGTKAWTVNQWIGWQVITGGRVGLITANTATQLTVAIPQHTAIGWRTPLGEDSTTPPLGAYVITSLSGVCEVSDNDIDCGADGNAKGRYGIWCVNDRAGSRIVVRNNRIKNPTSWGIAIAGSNLDAIQAMDISDNKVWDDQGSAATTSAAIRFEDAVSLTSIARLIMSGNTVWGGGAALDSNVTTGVWLLRDGNPQQWTGFGIPAMAAADGSTYQRRDGAAGTTLYVRAAGAWTALT